MFIRDWERFMPVKPMIFERAFAILGVPLSMAGNSNWDNYSAFLSRLRAVQLMLTQFGVPAVRLIDAHSFCWMLATLKISAARAIPRARYETLVPRPGDPPLVASESGDRFAAGQSEIDYDEQKRCGVLAEAIVLQAERDRLTAADRADLAARVKDVSGDPLLGYDIASFTADGQLKPIEVKAAARRGSSLRFFVSANEWRRSKLLTNYTRLRS